MPIESTTIQPISPTGSRVHMVISDDRAPADLHLDLDVVVTHADNPLLADVQAAALRILRDELIAEDQRLASLPKLNS